MRHCRYIAIPLFLALAGCGAGDLSLLEKAAGAAGKVEDATLGNAMKALPKYCTLPGSARSAMRSRANARPEAGGNKIAVYCVGDSPVTLGP